MRLTYTRADLYTSIYDTLLDNCHIVVCIMSLNFAAEYPITVNIPVKLIAHRNVEYCMFTICLNIEGCAVFRCEVSERMQYRTAKECENHYTQCYLVKPQSPLPGI